jgi:hypothetical protein
MPENLMRAVVFCLATLAVAAPAMAADDIADQASRAYQTFAGNLSQQDFLGAQYGNNLFAGVAGTWVRLNGPDPKAGIETYGADTKRFCASRAAVTLSSPNSWSLTVTTNLNGPNFSQVYTLIAGSTFGEHTDAEPYLTAIGLGPDKTGPNIDQQRALLLSLANGLVQMYRPSDDVLVMTRDRGYPIVLARCPAPDATTAPDSSPAPSSAAPDASASSTPAQ